MQTQTRLKTMARSCIHVFAPLKEEAEEDGEADDDAAKEAAAAF